MPTEYQFDVFISYSSHDKAWVRGELLKPIEQAGLKAFIDFRDFTRGALRGFDKRALAWHWPTHNVAPAAWPRVVWWTFFEGNAILKACCEESTHML